MEKYLYVLQKSSLFKQIKDTDILAILKCLNGRVVNFKKNKFIFLAGDTLNSMGLVLSGAVQITNDDIYGNKTILSELKKGSIFGETIAHANLDKIPVSVIASKDSDILMFDYRIIVKKCPKNCVFHNKLIENMLEIIAKKIFMQNEKLEILSQRSTREKLLTFFSLQSKAAGSNAFTISFDRQELADYLCVDRSALSRELGKMREEGIIDFHKNNFKFLL